MFSWYFDEDENEVIEDSGFAYDSTTCPNVRESALWDAVNEYKSTNEWD